MLLEQSDEIIGVSQSSWENFSWKQYLWSKMKKSSISRMQRFMYSQILWYVLEKWSRTQHPIMLGTAAGLVQRFITIPELWTQLTEIDGIRVEQFPRFIHWSLSAKSKIHEQKWANQNNSKDELSSCRRSNDIIWWIDPRQWNGMYCSFHTCVFFLKRFQQDVGHSLYSDQKRSGLLITTKDHEEDGTESPELMMIKFGESGHPVFRATSPLSRGTLKSKGGGKLPTHFCADGDTIKNCSSHNYFCNQLSIYGTVLRFCGIRYLPKQVWREPVLAEQSDPLFASANSLIMTPEPSIEIPAQEKIMQKYKERVEKLPHSDRLIKICIDARFVKIVEVGQ